MEIETKEFTDEELMAQVAGGEHGSFSMLVRRHTKRFYSLAYRMLSDREEAEDIVQDSFLMLWESPENYDSSKKTKFTTWFYRIIVNRCLDKKKKSREITLSDEFEISDNSGDTEAIINMKRKQCEIEVYLKELPESQQTALNICFYEGVSNKEAAEIMGVSLKAIESLLMRAKSSLRTKMMGRYQKVVV
jgi:RNA polymerase sigma-70 factor (ECF subfamily)